MKGAIPTAPCSPRPWSAAASRWSTPGTTAPSTCAGTAAGFRCSISIGPTTTTSIRNAASWRHGCGRWPPPWSWPRELGYKIVWTGHNIYPHNRLHRSIDHEFRLEICRLADAVIAHCPVNAQGLKERFGRTRRVFVIPHGHFIDVYRTDFTRGDARRELEVPQDTASSTASSAASCPTRGSRN